jgi:hypothetical protein
MNNELVRIGRKRSWVRSKYQSGSFLEELRRTTNDFTQDSLCPDRDSNRPQVEYNSRTLYLDHGLQYFLEHEPATIWIFFAGTSK